jgi:hypothetical protein
MAWFGYIARKIGRPYFHFPVSCLPESVGRVLRSQLLIMPWNLSPCLIVYTEKRGLVESRLWNQRGLASKLGYNKTGGGRKLFITMANAANWLSSCFAAFQAPFLRWNSFMTMASYILFLVWGRSIQKDRSSCKCWSSQVVTRSNQVTTFGGGGGGGEWV